MTAPVISYACQAERIEITILGKRDSLARFSTGSKKWPDRELAELSLAIDELEACHVTLLRVVAKAAEQEQERSVA